MRFEELQQTTKGLPWFDLPLLTQMTGQDKGLLTIQLSRWRAAGKVIPLRRGLYTLAEPYRRVDLSTSQLANEIYKPSCLSHVWALSFYGLIPEMVVQFTSVTTRTTRTFKNTLGHFVYFHLKKNLFWGFRKTELDKQPIWMAEPEKALLDFFHLSPGPWSQERLEALRLQNLEVLDKKKLKRYTTRWNGPRMHNIIKLLLKL